MVDFENQFKVVIQGNVEGLEQGIELLNSMTNDQYCMRAKPYIESSIGEHLRHILDLYYSVQHSGKNNIVDYDVRRRGALVESCRQTGLSELEAIKTWLLSLNNNDVSQSILISSEVSVISTEIAQVKSTLLRELVFVSAHAIHHYALMIISAKLCNFKTPQDMGLAPATLSSIRGDARCAL